MLDFIRDAKGQEKDDILTYLPNYDKQNNRVKSRIRCCEFLRIFTRTDDRLYEVRLGYSRVKECPAD